MRDVPSMFPLKWCALLSSRSQCCLQVCQNINPNIYGEVTADGCAMMFKNLPPAARLDDDSVIYDLGSGYGKFRCSATCFVLMKRRVPVP
jgi:hypothetical protein